MGNFEERIERIKRTVDIVELARQHTDLKRWGNGGEFAGACPKCSAAKDGFHVHEDGWFKCYTCHNEHHSDVIELVQWLHGYDFKTALDYLDGNGNGNGNKPALPRKQPRKPKPKPRNWQDARWQREAQHAAQQAQANLSLVVDYLAQRGITTETAQAWDLGGVDARGRKFVVFTWQGKGVVKALNFRSADEGERRFFQRKGSERTLYGVDLITNAATLIIAEGELNALSLWQVTRGQDVDVVSTGAEANVSNDYARQLATRYQYVLVWTDKPDYAKKFMSQCEKAQGLQSPDGLDANDLLQRGLLQDFISAALDRLRGAEQRGRSCPSAPKQRTDWQSMNDDELTTKLTAFTLKFAEYSDNGDVPAAFDADYARGLAEFEQRNAEPTPTPPEPAPEPEPETAAVQVRCANCQHFERGKTRGAMGKCTLHSAGEWELMLHYCDDYE